MVVIDFAVVILFFVAVIIFGVLLNIYLYSRGALDDYCIDDRRYKPCVVMFPEFEQPVVKTRTSDSVMGDYVRRVVLVTFACIGFLIALCILLITSFH